MKLNKGIIRVSDLLLLSISTDLVKTSWLSSMSVMRMLEFLKEFLKLSED